MPVNGEFRIGYFWASTNLDGSESELTVDDEARAMATARLALIAARKAQEAERKA